MGLLRYLLLFLVIFFAVRFFQAMLRKKRAVQPRPEPPPPSGVKLKPCDQCGTWVPMTTTGQGESHLCPNCRDGKT